jgi:hydrogenase-4 component F
MSAPLFLLVAVPLLGAVAGFLVRSERSRLVVLPAAGILHFALTLAAIARAASPGATVAEVWIDLDPLGALTLGIVSLLFLLCSFYAVGYLRLHPDRSNKVLVASLLVFLAMTSLLCLAQHLALLWVAIEATTLSTAVLVYYNQSPRAIQAAWKYLMVSSVGIALALLGTFFLAYSAYLGHEESSLLFRSLTSPEAAFSRPWLRAAFVLLLVGYGTKMGLAPLHTWKPDAYGEAPGLVGALLAGGLSTCSFLAVLRVYRIVDAAGEGEFARKHLLALGLVSVAVAAFFLARQRDFKRMLAYSSVEHMGILVLGIGVGGGGIYGSLLHMINNGLTKGALFLAAANIQRTYGSKEVGEVSGALRLLPLSGSLFLAGFFAITGSPPFGPFISEFTILYATIQGQHPVAAGTLLALLVAVFVGMGFTVLAVLMGSPAPRFAGARPKEELLLTLPIVAAMLLVLVMGVWIPEPVRLLLEAAAASLEAHP